MNLDIISPEKLLYSGKIEYVNLPGTHGSFGVLENHAPIISTLKKGVIVLRDLDSTEHKIEINGGVVEVLKNKVIVLAE